MEIMKPGKIATPTKTKEMIAKYGLTLKKSLGQNFLIDPNVLQRIVDAAQLDATKGVLEIGPGIGALTQRLAETAGRVAAVEIDQRLVPVLRDTLQLYPNVEIVHGDVLRLDLAALFQSQFADVSAVSVVANLPYYITTPIVMKLLEERLPLEHIVVMVQREVAERMAAKPGSKAYGSLSIAVQWYCEPKYVMTVPHTVFIPQPHVDSAVVKLTLRTEPPAYVRDEAHFFRVVQACFAQRRKTIYNNLKHAFPQQEGNTPLLDALNACQIDPSRRGETLSIEEYAALSEELL